MRRSAVATAAFYPSVNLAPGIGWESGAISNLLSAPSLMWSLGLSVAQTLFDAGRTRATVKYAEAGYTASVADYRQTVLTAMQGGVEDGITGLGALERAAGGASRRGGEFATRARPRQRPLCRRPCDLSRRDHGAADPADQPASRRANRRPADADHGVPGEGPGRRLAGSVAARGAHPERVSVFDEFDCVRLEDEHDWGAWGDPENNGITISALIGLRQQHRARHRPAGFQNVLERRGHFPLLRCPQNRR
ncbi:MAG: TolC family protein [Rhodospirillales bacterium]